MTLSEQAAKAIKEATGWDAYQSRNGAGVNSAGGTDIRLYWHTAAGEWRSYIKNKRLVLPERGEGPTPEAALNDVLPRYRAHIAALAADVLPGWPRLEWEIRGDCFAVLLRTGSLCFVLQSGRIYTNGTGYNMANYNEILLKSEIIAGVKAHVESLGLPCPLPPFPGVSDA